MSFYRYACEFTNEAGEPAYVRSIVPFTHSEVVSHKTFTYRYYTSESENEGSETCYVVSLGYEKRDPNRSLTFSKAYNRYSLHYFISGNGYFGDEPIRAGTLLFVPPYKDRVFYSSPDAPLEFYYITVSGVGSEVLMNDAGFTLTEGLSECPFIEKIPPFFDKILFEPIVNSDQRLYLLGFLYQLMAFHKHYSANTEDVPTDKGFFYYKQALSYIEAYLLDGTTPSDIARYLQISQPYLRKIFAKYSKYSLREYLLRKKIKHAANMLAYSQCTVYSAANAIGYGDYTQFTKLFKKYMGVSPSTYKNTHKEDIATDA